MIGLSISELALILFFGLCAVFSAIVVRRSIARLFRRQPETPPMLRFLGVPDVRSELTGFLHKNMVVGDADIRDGVVYPRTRLGEAGPLASILENAATVTVGFKNPNASSLYVYDPHRGSFMLLRDLDLDHIADAARIIRHVAEKNTKT